MALKLALPGLAALTLTVLAGCAGMNKPTSPPASTQPAPTTGICNAQGAQFAVGKAPVASLVEQARQRSGSYMARVLRPGQVVTMEFNAQRLNLDLDTAGVITRARCG